MTIEERKIAFESELKSLLTKFDCELCVEDFGSGYHTDEKIVVDFNFKEDSGYGQLMLGRYVDGK